MSFINNPITTASGTINTTYINCRRFTSFRPSFTPVIINLSVTSSQHGDYSFVYIYGENFLPNGTTYVNFGKYKKINVIYYSSGTISFVVPANAEPGLYEVIVVNIYNNNLAQQTQFYNTNLNYSNPEFYTVV